ncbi:MAG: AmmeMemoRadiSam system protein A [Pseudomonadota bacterium]|nr:MAG: AmmeMemoRadiSam system protein A [Pseudomonadota bacterium]
MSSNSYTGEERDLLLKTAGDSIDHGLLHGCALKVDASDYPEALRDQRATFVTLTINKQLRGCIGVLEARMPLIVDVANNAYSAAFSDPRFPPLGKLERGRLEIKISILTPPEALAFDSEEDLIEKLRPGVDGLILEEGSHRGTFLPAVWESLPDRREFLSHLKQKAGLAPNYWSDRMQVQRYRAVEIS